MGFHTRVCQYRCLLFVQWVPYAGPQVWAFFCGCVNSGVCCMCSGYYMQGHKYGLSFTGVSIQVFFVHAMGTICRATSMGFCSRVCQCANTGVYSLCRGYSHRATSLAVKKGALHKVSNFHTHTHTHAHTHTHTHTLGLMLTTIASWEAFAAAGQKLEPLPVVHVSPHASHASRLSPCKLCLYVLLLHRCPFFLLNYLPRPHRLFLLGLLASS